MPTSYCIARFFSSANEIGFIFMPTLFFRPPSFRWIHPGPTVVLWTLWIEPSVGFVFNRYPRPPPLPEKGTFAVPFVKNSVIASSGLLALFTNGGRNYF